MERSGVVGFTGDVEYDELGALTKFRELGTSLVKKCVSEGMWFTFGRAINENQVDVLSIKNKSGISLGKMVRNCYSESNYLVSVFKYMLHDYMCYCEVPVVKRSQDLNGFQNSFNKFLVTSSLEVVADWMGISLDEAYGTYGKVLNSDVEADEPDEEFPYVKLYTDKTGVRKVTKPRSYLDLGSKDIRIIPIFALKAGVDTLWGEVLIDDVYEISFVKDSGQVRSMVVSSDETIVKNMYGFENAEFVARNWTSCYGGDFLSNSSLDRGYIRVFEIGSSVYSNPTRSINYARIVGIKEGKADMTYIYIDTDRVLEAFFDYIYRLDNSVVPQIVNMLDLMEVGSLRTVNGRAITSLQLLENWASIQETTLSTVFIRQLAIFMIGNQQWFPGYTGARVESEGAKQGTSTSIETQNPSEGTGDGDMPFDLELAF